MSLPERKSLFMGYSSEEKVREPKGHHTLSFDGTTIKVGDATLIACKDGWEEMVKLCGTRSPTEIAKKLIAFAYNYNHGLIPPKEEKEKPSK